MSILVGIVLKGIGIQLLKIQKFRQSHIEGQGNFVQRLDPGILGQAPDNIVQGGLLHVAHGGQLVDGQSPFLAQGANPFDIEI